MADSDQFRYLLRCGVTFHTPTLPRTEYLRELAPSEHPEFRLRVSRPRNSLHELSVAQYDDPIKRKTRLRTVPFDEVIYEVIYGVPIGALRFQ
jgi:hypothetical protein